MEFMGLFKQFGLEVDAKTFELNRLKKVVVGMSGGVDSSVSALILKYQGYQVFGLFMKNWDEIDENGVCSTEEDYRDVVSVCEAIDIPYYSVNFVEEYRKQVFESFLNEYKMGHTPNPDILCNREIKFKIFFNYAMDLGADLLATGHYCERVDDGEHSYLMKGKDPNKDQSYFLYTMKEEILRKVLFPVGGLPKPQVRQLAQAMNLSTGNKKDSTGICFIGERNFKNFLSQYIETQKGAFKTLDGQVVGQHDGACFYTLGQRKGLGLGGQGEPWFVVAKEASENVVYVERGEFHSAMYADELWAQEWSFVSSETVEWLGQPRELTAKVRYRQKNQACVAQIIDGYLHVTFPVPQRAITHRQSVVLYDGEKCLGGAIIQKVGESYWERKIALPEIVAE